MLKHAEEWKDDDDKLRIMREAAPVSLKRSFKMSVELLRIKGPTFLVA